MQLAVATDNKPIPYRPPDAHDICLREEKSVQNVNVMMKNHALAQLIGEDSFVGWIYDIDYDTAKVMTNDLWKARVDGVPHNCFLLAASFDPSAFARTATAEQEVILLRVVGSATLPQGNDLVRTKIDHFQEQTSIYHTADQKDYDDLTRNQLQFHGLECRVLGTFFVRDDVLHLGSDLETFASAASLNVYRPRGAALGTIVNYVDPIRRAKAEDEAKQLGIQNPITPFRIGTVRYTSSDRLHRASAADLVPVHVQPSDFLARRTAVLGMTRTGKSNIIKQMVAVVKRVADEGGVKIGQIIYDINGEYANANKQDQGSIADVFPQDTVRYRMLKPPAGFLELRTNFYEQLTEGFAVIRRELMDANRVTSDYVRSFVNISLEEPDRQEYDEHNRWDVRAAAYRVLLFKAGFQPPQGYRVRFTASQAIQGAVGRQANAPIGNPDKGLTLPEAVEWFESLRLANLAAGQNGLQSTSGKAWVDDSLSNLLDMMVQKSKGTNNYISGYAVLTDAQKYHSPNRAGDVAQEIYRMLAEGKIVILDLSVGDPIMREKLSKDIVAKIFRMSMDSFVQDKVPPNVIIYVEEAHNLIGKDMDLSEAWPRLAKEGAKYRIGLVYATQEVSSVHPNILSNTENWVVSHLNNDREVRELARFYDFADFSRSLIRAQDVGFARVKTLSGPFVVPVQVDRFDPSYATTPASGSRRSAPQRSQRVRRKVKDRPWLETPLPSAGGELPGSTLWGEQTGVGKPSAGNVGGIEE